ncbi:CHAD domain-containing protein [Rhizobium sp. NPDC090275]|uniref:CYTH and CHAD domain-containing protein n=1 Tax=Rhizobium sp. NPDC090275 TaxID=3364498 RepID=UPI00383B619E
MSSETEIKLDLSQEAFDALVGSDLLGEPDKVLDQRSTYFDTADRRLWKEGYTLRIRQVGDTRMQTVKATGPSRSLFARSEWETPLEGNEPVLDHTSPLLGEFGSDLALEPVFDVVIARRLWNVVENGSQIEVVLDEGNAISDDRHSPIREVEIELKEGSPSDLFVFARKIDAVAAFRFGVRSKAERGFVLADVQKTVFKAEPVQLERSMNAAVAFKSIALSCVRQFRLNEDILLQRRNPEALHQTRVALRRLRSAFSLFKSVLSRDEPKRLNQELRWLAAVLGEARDIDVLLAKASDADLVSKLKTARAATYRDAVDALGSSRTRALMLDLINWLECGDYLPGNGPVSADVPGAQDFAARVLEKQRKRLKKDGSALAKADDEHRHDVRKDAKKLRYAAEFFASLFDDKRSARRYKKFLTAMEALQDELGALNDLATGPEVLEKHGLADHPAKDTVISHRDKAGLLGKAQAAVDDVLDTKRFWR